MTYLLSLWYFCIIHAQSLMENSHKPKCTCLSCDFRELVFSSLNEEDIDKICEEKVEIPFSKGDIIHNEGDVVRYFKYLKQGLVKLYKRSPGGDEQIITIAKPYEFVSNTHVFTEDHYKYSLSALEDSVACCIKIDVIKNMIERNGHFALKLITMLSGTSEKIITQGLEIRNRNLAGRVAFVLEYLSKEIYNSKVFDLPVSRREIADFISMSTANVIRTFSEFKRDGIIKTYGRTIEIIDMPKLEVISKRG